MKCQWFNLRVMLNVMVILMLSACGTSQLINSTSSSEPSSPATATPPAGAPVNKEKVDVGGYGLYINCYGEGSPTVLMDAGLNSENSMWLIVMGKIPDDLNVRICGYDRAFLGRSDAAPTKPRTNLDMAHDLHNLLVNANIPGPFVLVAHSMAGYTAQLYVDEYPQDVVGVVLVDSAHPDEMESTLAILSDDIFSGDNEVALIRGRYRRDPGWVSEYWDRDASIETVQELGTMGSIPLVVLTGDDTNPLWHLDLRQTTLGVRLPNELVDMLENNWYELQKELAQLSTNSMHQIVDDSRHFIPGNQPEAVAEAIEWVLEQVRE